MRKPKPHPTPSPVSLGAIQKGAIQEPEHQRDRNAEYVEWRINKGSDNNHKVVHLERMKSETVFGTEHVVLDVHTNEPGRWWVITESTNLYSHHEFPSLDYCFPFTSASRQESRPKMRRLRPATRKDRLRSTWRRWENAAEAIDTAREAEDFQAV